MNTGTYGNILFITVLFALSSNCCAVCNLGPITTSPGTGAYVYIYDLGLTPTSGDEAIEHYLIEGTKTESYTLNDVPCDHYYAIWVKKPDVIYAYNDKPSDTWSPSTDGAQAIGKPSEANNDLHFRGLSYAVAICTDKTVSPNAGCPPFSVQYTITVTNCATPDYGAALTTVSVVDTLPPGLSFDPTIPPSSTPVVVGNTLTWTFNGITLNVGSSLTITFNARLNGVAYGQLMNQETATGSTPVMGSTVTATANPANSIVTAYPTPVATIGYTVTG